MPKDLVVEADFSFAFSTINEWRGCEFVLLAVSTTWSWTPQEVMSCPRLCLLDYFLKLSRRLLCYQALCFSWVDLLCTAGTCTCHPTVSRLGLDTGSELLCIAGRAYSLIMLAS